MKKVFVVYALKFEGEEIYCEVYTDEEKARQAMNVLQEKDYKGITFAERTIIE